MEVFVLQIVTIKKNSIVRYLTFVMILAVGFGVVIATHDMKRKMVDTSVYFVDSEMMRLVKVRTSIPKASTELMAQTVLDELIRGRDENPKIYRIIPKIENGLSVKVVGEIAYIDMTDDFVQAHPDGRDQELLTIYSIVNSITSIDGITNVRFTIDGIVQKNFKGYIDMRETFIPDYLI